MDTRDIKVLSKHLKEEQIKKRASIGEWQYGGPLAPLH